MVKPAADGSIISRAVTEEYLASEDYKTIIRDKIALGGKTHKDRIASDEYKQIIGPDDEVLVKRNSLFYIKKIFIKEDSEYCWAIIHIYDPDNFSGELRDEIANLRAMLKEGTKLPCSVVIQAIWSPTNECLKIIRIKGVDFTLNPSFEGAGTEKLMSMTVVSDAPETKMFSEKGARTGVRLFSFDTEILKPSKDDEIVSEKEILSKFGRNSEQYRAYSTLKKATDDGIVKKADLSSILSGLQASDSAISQQDFLNYLEEYVTPENQQLFVTIFNQGVGKIQQLVNAVPKTEPNYDELIKIRLINYLNTLPKSDKLFSITSIVEDKYSLFKYPRTIRVRLLMRLYMNFYKSNQGTLSDDAKAYLEKLFINDWTLLIKDAIPYMNEGLNISSYYQLAAINPEFSQLGRELSYYYRRLLISESQLGFIPTSIYVKWSESLSKFLNFAISVVFGERLSSNNLSFIKG